MKRSTSLIAAASLLFAAASASSASGSSPSGGYRSHESRQQHRRQHSHRRHDRHRHRRRAQATEVDEGDVLSATTLEQVATTSMSGETTTRQLTEQSSSEYNTRMEPCPGYEEQNLRGYTSFTALQSDLLDYFNSFETSSPTSSPTTSMVPTTATKSPTLQPSSNPTSPPSFKPTASPTSSPSELPTKAPITLRPTPFPTSSIRQQQSPTSSPFPTIQIVIVGMTDTNGDGVPDSLIGGGGGEDGEEVVLTYPPGSEPGVNGGGFVSFQGPSPPGGEMISIAPAASPDVLVETSASPMIVVDIDAAGDGNAIVENVEGSDDGEAGNAEMNDEDSSGGGKEEAGNTAGNTLDQFMDDRNIRGRALSSAQTIQFQKVGKLGGKQHNYSHPQQKYGQNVGRNRRMQEKGEAGSGISANEMDSQLIQEGDGMMEEVQMTATTSEVGGSSSEQVGLVMSSSEGAEEEEGEFLSIETFTQTPEEVIQPASSKEEEGDGEAEDEFLSVATFTQTPTELTAQSTMIDSLPTVKFHICPNSNFDLNSEASDALKSNMEPLVIETPVQHSIEIGCLSSGGDSGDKKEGEEDGEKEKYNCVFDGGAVHMLFKHIPDNPNKVTSTENSDDKNQITESTSTSTSSTQQQHQITINNLTFQQATQSSIKMNDPRGFITFQNCAWQKNMGEAAIWIDGKFNSTKSAMESGVYDLKDEDGEDGKGSDGGDGSGNDDGSGHSVGNSSGGSNTGGGGGGGKLSRTSSTLDWSIMETTSTEFVSTKVPPADSKVPDPTATPPGDRNLLSTEFASTKVPPAEGRALFWTGTMSTMSANNDDNNGNGGMLAAMPIMESEAEYYQVSTELEYNEQLAQWQAKHLMEYENIMQEMEEMTIMEQEQEEEQRRMRLLEEVTSTVPRSIISIEQCSFTGNKGNATIMISSYSDEMTLAETDPGVLTHNDDLLNADNDTSDSDKVGDESSSNSGMRMSSIHLAIKETTFISEDVDTSIIENQGARLQSSNVVFTNNTAESIIRSEQGTVAMSFTEFSMNEVKGDGGVVVLDLESSLEKNEGNCDRRHNAKDDDTDVVESSSESNGLDSFSERQGESGSSSENGTEEGLVVSEAGVDGAAHCDGIYSGGICKSFESCPEDNNNDDEKKDDAVVAEANCFSVWDDLVVAVQDRQPNVRDFIICPGSVLVATSSPLIIDSDYITIQCGNETLQSKDCAIMGGYSHFHIVGSPTGVQLARLSLWASTGSSIMALGSAGATLNLIDCEWIENSGASVILIYNDEDWNATTGGEELDILSLMEADTNSSETAGAMSVEVIDCTFGNNELSFGAIANIGGTLSVYKSQFKENTSNGGEIVVTNGGSCTVQGSCFNASASVAPGIIFIEEGSELSSNTDNFGSGNTAGGYGDKTCLDVFQEADGANCLDPSEGCDGSCSQFTSTVCAADGDYDGASKAPSASPKDNQIRVPAYTQDEGSGGPSKVVPIVVATVVCAFIVFGLVGILVRRRKGSSNRASTDGTEQTGGLAGKFKCGCCKRRRGKNNNEATYDAGAEEDDVGINFDDDDAA